MPQHPDNRHLRRVGVFFAGPGPLTREGRLVDQQPGQITLGGAGGCQFDLGAGWSCREGSREQKREEKITRQKRSLRRRAVLIRTAPAGRAGSGRIVGQGHGHFLTDWDRSGSGESSTSTFSEARDDSR